MIAVIGAGGHGKVVAETLEVMNLGTDIVMFDDAYASKQKDERWPLIGQISDLRKYKSKLKFVVLAIGNNDFRMKLYSDLANDGYNLPTIIHPASIVSRYADVKAGTVILAGAVVNADAKIGTASIINTSSVVEHDCLIGDGCHLSPNSTIAGNCEIGSRSWVGMGAIIKQGLKIGQNVTIGAGAAVVNNVPADQVVVGVPAVPLKSGNKIC